MTTPEPPYEILQTRDGVPLYCWTRGVPVEQEARSQLRRVARLPIVFRHVAVMPDVHVGMGATIGSVIPTVDAIIPAAVGVDIGCGMCAAKTSLGREDLPRELHELRETIERAVPHGRDHHGGKGDRGSWGHGRTPKPVLATWRKELERRYEALVRDDTRLRSANAANHLGTLGTGNHFIELSVEPSGAVWLVLHSGSRGIGNALARHFIHRAKRSARERKLDLVDLDLAWFEAGTEDFNRYLEAATWAQKFARLNRALMLDAVVTALGKREDLPTFALDGDPVNCHHNYVAREEHYDQEVLVTRKGAVRAGAGEPGIIPGSMGARSYIVRGKGEPLSFSSCSHGAGRAMSRSAAKKRFTVAEHVAATAGVSCRKDAGVLDETPGAYKDIEAVMAAQADLVEVVTELKQVVCVKG